MKTQSVSVRELTNAYWGPILVLGVHKYILWESDLVLGVHKYV
jgi:hypothetical protein